MADEVFLLFLDQPQGQDSGSGQVRSGQVQVGGAEAAVTLDQS